MICVGEEKKKVALTDDRGGTSAVEDVAKLLLQAVDGAFQKEGGFGIVGASVKQKESVKK